MAVATEIERLLVRLVGDATSYQKMLKDAEKSTKSYGKTQKELDQALQRGKQVTLSVENATEKYNRETKELKNLLKVGAINQETFNRAMARSTEQYRKATDRVEKLTRKLKALGAGMRRVGRTMSLAITAPLTIIGGLSVRAFAQFDNAMIQSTSIMKVTEAQMAEMRDTAISLSGVSAQGPKVMAESYFFLASAGKNAAQSMALLPKVAAFATAGTFDMALATDLLTDAQSALGLASKNVAQDERNLVRVSDVLVKANTLANASVQQFSVALTSKAGAALKSYNVDVEEGVAVLAALADQGIKAQLAGNALDRVIRLLSKASRDNTKEFKQLGFSVFKTDGSMRNLADIIGNIEDITKSMSVEMKSATLEMLGFEARVQGVILPLLGTSDAIRKYEKELKNARGITKEVAEKQMKSFSNQMKLLKNQLTIVGIEIGQVLAPIIRELGKLVKSAITAWKGFDDTTKTVIVSIGIVAAVLGPLLITMGSLIQLIGFAAKGFVALKASALGVKFALGGIAALGIAAVFIAIRRAISAANAELDKTIEKVLRLQGKRLEIIENLKGAQRENALINERSKLLSNVRVAQVEITRELNRQRKEMGGETFAEGARIFNLRGALGLDPVVAFKENLETAKRELEQFQDFKIRLGKQSTGVGTAGGEKKTTEETSFVVRSHIDSLRIAEFNRASEAEKAAKRVVSVERGRNLLAASHNALIQKGAELTKQFLAPQEKLLKRQKKLQLLLNLGKISQATFARASLSAQEEFDQGAKKGAPSRAPALGRVTGVRAGSLEAQQRVAEYKALRGEGEKAGVAKSNDLLERIAVATEGQVAKPGLEELEPAGLN